jgi:hypothetical protein
MLFAYYPKLKEKILKGVPKFTNQLRVINTGLRISKYDKING